MKTTYTIAAIAMFAVIMGMSAFVPAAMARGPPTNEDNQVCHRGGVATSDPSDDEWVVMNLPNQHAKDKHIDHGDYGIPDDTDVDECEDQTLIYPNTG